MPDAAPASGHFADGKHWIEYRIYYEDTDAGGIVYNANYLRFAERARTEALRLIGFEQSHFRKETGILFVVRHASLDFTAPARLDDVLTIETTLHDIGKTRMNLRQAMHARETLCCKVESVIVSVGANGRPTAIPEALREAMTTHFLQPQT